MNELVEEDVFEIVDYTSASPWERFISSIEHTLTLWGLQGNKLGVFSKENLEFLSRNNSINLKTSLLACYNSLLIKFIKVRSDKLSNFSENIY